MLARIPLFLLLVCLWGTDAVGQVSVKNAFPNLTFSSPTKITSAGDGTDRLFVLEKLGVIRVFDNDPSVAASSVFLDLRSRVIAIGEQGLLGLAFHPNYVQNGYFYVNYIAPNPDRTVVSRFTASPANANAADASSEFILLEIMQPFRKHNGGDMHFADDGTLFISVGDGGNSDGTPDPLGHGQNAQTLLGTMLRIDVDSPSGGKNYTIPPDNPFVGNSENIREEIYAWGFRNPWRFSIDPLTDKIWVGDVGKGSWEEIDVLVAGGNYGWSIMEGAHCFNAASCNMTGLELPVYEYSHSNGDASITGGFVYRGGSFASLNGKYIYGDFISGRIWALEDIGTGFSNELVVDTDFGMTSFGLDESGEIYIAAWDGDIHTFTSPSQNGKPVFTSTPVTAGTQEQPYLYNITTSDPDGDAVSLVATQVPPWLNLTDNGNGSGTLSGTPTNAEVGSHDVILSANDGVANSQQSFTIVVANVNDPPVFTSAAVTAATQDQPYFYNITTSDPDGDDVSFTATQVPLWLDLTDSGDGTGTLAGTPGNDDVGPHEVVLTASDGSASTQQSFTIVVANVNDPPVFTSTAVTAATQEQPYLYNITTSDPDGDIPSLTRVNAPGWLNLTDNGDGTGALSGTPQNDDMGSHEVVLAASDGVVTVEQSFEVVVVDVNDAPVFTSTAVTAAVQDESYVYEITTSDPDGHAVSVVAGVAPAWLNLTDNGDGTAVLAGVPTNADVGAHDVTLTASDGSAATDQSFVVVVANVNDPPVITSEPLTTIMQGESYAYAVTASDPDQEDEVTLSAPVLPAWLTLTTGGSGTATLSGVPTFDHAGEHAVSIRAVDTAGGEDLQSFIVTVKTVNRPPVAVDDAYSVAEGEVLESGAGSPGVLANDSDPDNDLLTVAILVGPTSGMVSMLSDGNFTYTHDGSETTSDAFTYTASDGSLDDNASVFITVLPRNDPPSPAEISTPPAGASILVEGDQAEEIVIQWTSSVDPEATTVTYAWQLGTTSEMTIVLATVDVDTSRYIVLSLGQIESLLDANGVGVGESVELYHRVVSSDGENVTVGPSVGVFLTRGIVTAVQDEDLPSTLTLYQNYPNPFNPSTLIEFDLPSGGPAALSVFDILGREVEPVFTGTLPAGHHEFRFDASDLPSGLYVYRLEAAGMVMSRTMLLLR